MIFPVRGGTPYGATTIAGGDGSRQPSNEELSIARYQGEYVAGLAKTQRLTPNRRTSMPTQESKAHHVGEWASLRNTSPEIAEAIFEVAKYDEKLAEQIWEEGNDEVLVRAFEKRTKTRSSGVSKPSNVKRLSVSPASAGFSLTSPRYSSPH